MADQDVPAGDDVIAGEDGVAPAAPIAFSQDDVNRIVQERLAEAEQRAAAKTAAELAQARQQYEQELARYNEALQVAAQAASRTPGGQPDPFATLNEGQRQGAEVIRALIRQELGPVMQTVSGMRAQTEIERFWAQNPEAPQDLRQKVTSEYLRAAGSGQPVTLEQFYRWHYFDYAKAGKLAAPVSAPQPSTPPPSAAPNPAVRAAAAAVTGTPAGATNGVGFGKSYKAMTIEELKDAIRKSGQLPGNIQ